MNSWDSYNGCAYPVPNQSSRVQIAVLERQLQAFLAVSRPIFNDLPIAS